MSQKKVDQYKEYKKNRKEIIEKEKKQKKREMAIYSLVGIIFLAIICGGIGLTVYNSQLRKAKQFDSDQKIIADLAGILTSEEISIEE